MGSCRQAQPSLGFWLHPLLVCVNFFGFSGSHFSHLLKEDDKSACCTGEFSDLNRLTQKAVPTTYKICLNALATTSLSSQDSE